MKGFATTELPRGVGVEDTAHARLSYAGYRQRGPVSPPTYPPLLSLLLPGLSAEQAHKHNTSISHT